MHSGVQTRTIIVHERLVQAGYAFVVGVNIKSGETVWIHAKPKSKHAWAMGLVCNSGVVFMSKQLAWRIVGLNAETGLEAWSAPAPGCDTKYNCVEGAHAKRKRLV